VLDDLRGWLDGWLIWVLVLGSLAVTTGVVAVMKLRARAEERRPQYRRERV